MRLVHRLLPVAAMAALVPTTVKAQVGYGGYNHPQYGYGINSGVVGPGYQSAYQLNRQTGYAAGRAQTVIDYQPLINAITSIPGWYGPPPSAPHPIHPHPVMTRDKLLRDDGTILWPKTTPDDPARSAAEAAVKVVVAESQKYQHANTRHVVDARNKLKAFARAALPALKAKSAADADELERFIVELQKTLATMAVNF